MSDFDPELIGFNPDYNTRIEVTALRTITVALIAYICDPDGDRPAHEAEQVHRKLKEYADQAVELATISIDPVPGALEEARGHIQMEVDHLFGAVTFGP